MSESAIVYAAVFGSWIVLSIVIWLWLMRHEIRHRRAIRKRIKDITDGR